MGTHADAVRATILYAVYGMVCVFLSMPVGAQSANQFSPLSSGREAVGEGKYHDGLPPSP